MVLPVLHLDSPIEQYDVGNQTDAEKYAHDAGHVDHVKPPFWCMSFEAVVKKATAPALETGGAEGFAMWRDGLRYSTI